jgi:hypothetical protein
MSRRRAEARHRLSEFLRLEIERVGEPRVQTLDELLA